MKLNCKKLLGTGIFSLAIVSAAVAGPVEKGIEFNQVNMYETAKAYLLQGIRSGNATAEAYYYLGDSYLMINKDDSAAYYFKKCAETNPEYALALVGEGKKALKEKNTVLAKELFSQATKKEKKNPAVYTAIADAYIEFNLYNDAPAMYEKARDVKKNYSNSFVSEGNMLVKQEKSGDAISKFENAIYFDSKNKQALLKEARVYKNINTTVALELLDKIIAVDADYVPAYIEYSDIYYTTGFFKKAITAYEKYIKEPGISIKDIEKYATVLYFSGEYAQSIEQVRMALKADPNNFIMKRIQLYNNFELGNEEIALEQAKNFFASKKEKDEYIGQDYLTYGKLLQKNKLDIEAIPYLEKAIELDSTKIDLYKDMASAYEKIEQYDKGIEYFQKYMDATPEPKTSDYYMFGRSFYQAGMQMDVQGDTIKKKEYLTKADEMFKEVTVQNADSYLGFQWRARTMSVMEEDPKTGLAKPMYEETLQKLLAVNEDGKRNKDVTECYMYLGNYYYLNNDKAKAIECFEKVLAINPDDLNLKKAVEDLKKSK